MQYVFNRYTNFTHLSARGFSRVDPFHYRKFLLDGLEKSKTRGYDGAGIATMSPQQGQMVSSHLILLSRVLFVQY